ncbi:MAG: D-glycero-beta-D-manno-heptose-7-phosphate kinase [Nitrospinota bacterium]
MNRSLYEIVKEHSSSEITVVGDIVLDKYVWGNVDRISPEAATKVLDVKDSEFRLGGAGNVAANVRSFGGTVKLVALLGDDIEADEVRKLLKHYKIAIRFLTTDKNDRKSSLKIRYMALRQQMLRVDVETRNEIGKKIEDQIFKKFQLAIGESKLVIISDYKKGMLTKSLLRRIILECKKKSIPTLVDPKGNDYSYYKGSTIITPNQKEASEASGIEINNESNLKKGASALLKVTDANHILITRGSSGMTLFNKKLRSHHFVAESLEVFDVSGAGDTVVAVLGALLAGGSQLEDAIKIANVAAGIVVGHLGARPILKEELLAALEPTASIKDKIVTQKEAQLLALLTKKKREKVVFTNGCFDILHAGHLELLEKSKKMGDFLIVAINSDRSIRRLKGSFRPLIKAEDRAKLLAGLSSVDLVVIFEELDPAKLIEKLKPDILVKGGDYDLESIVGYDIVSRYGGIVRMVPLVKGRSTTSIVDSIKRQKNE